MDGMPLSRYGYSGVSRMTPLARHRALGKAIRAGERALAVFRKLNLLMIYHKKTAPTLSRIFKKDRDWVKQKYLIKKVDGKAGKYHKERRPRG